MVVGKGLLAKSFERYENDDGFLIFASGVSNSKSNNFADFERESDLLNAHLSECGQKRFVYFSTCSINDPDLASTPYVVHKLAMERIISKNAKKYCIFRLSNVVGPTGNPNTVLNFLFESIKNGKKIELWINSERNLIDVDDVFSVVDYILTNSLFSNAVINIARPENFTIAFVVKTIEQYLNKKGNFDIVEKGSSFQINTDDVYPVMEKLSILKRQNPLELLLEKYYRKSDQNHTS